MVFLTKFPQKEKMKKTFAIAMFALLAVLAVSFATAEGLTSGIDTYVNGQYANSDFAISVGDTVPVKVVFTASENAEDVRVKVWLDGYRDEVSASTGRFNLVSGKTYIKTLNLDMPTDTKELTQPYTLHVLVSNADREYAKDYELTLQRESYSFNIDSVDYDTDVVAGQTIPVSVVVENNGMEDMEDGYVVVSIEELGIYAKGYFGDLVPVDNCDDDCTDSLQKTVYIKIPENAKPGVYEMSVKTYNKDSTQSEKVLINVQESQATQLAAAVKTQNVKAGESVTFELMLVNAGNNIKVYSIKTVSGSDLKVEAPSMVVVGPASSKVVPVTVKVDSEAKKGSYAFTVEVDGKEQVFTVNVNGKSYSNGVIALTVILAIVFIVLLVILIVLLAKKDKPAEEEETETSYY